MTIVHPALQALLDKGIHYEGEILDPTVCASLFQLEMESLSPAWSVETNINSSTVGHIGVEIVEVIWFNTHIKFNVHRHHPKMLDIIGSTLRVINELSPEV